MKRCDIQIAAGVTLVLQCDTVHTSVTIQKVYVGTNCQSAARNNCQGKMEINLRLFVASQRRRSVIKYKCNHDGIVIANATSRQLPRPVRGYEFVLMSTQLGDGVSNFSIRWHVRYDELSSIESPSSLSWVYVIGFKIWKIGPKISSLFVTETEWQHVPTLCMSKLIDASTHIYSLCRFVLEFQFAFLLWPIDRPLNDITNQL